MTYETRSTSTRDIERDIASTQAGIGEKLERLQEKASPRELADRAMHYAKGGGAAAARAGRSAGRTIRQHPIPAAVAGAGLAWLAYSIIRGNNHGHRSGASSNPGHESMGHKASAAAHDAADRARSMAGTAGRSIGRAGSWSAGYAKDHPLLLGGMAFTLGVVAASLLPQTRRENEWMGETSDDLKSSAKSAMQEQAERAQHAGSAAYEAARDDFTSAGQQEEEQTPQAGYRPI